MRNIALCTIISFMFCDPSSATTAIFAETRISTGSYSQSRELLNTEGVTTERENGVETTTPQILVGASQRDVYEGLDAFSSTSLQDGVLRVRALAPTHSSGFSEALATAAFRDTVTFFNPFVQADEGWDATYVIKVHGSANGDSATAPPFTGITIQSEFAGVRSVFSGFDIDDIYFRDNPDVAYEYDGLSATISYTYRATGQFVVANLATIITASALQGGLADFSNTARVSLVLPEGVTYASESGVFLTGSGAVPEPETWIMFVGGFGLIGGAIRRQPPLTVRYA